MIPAPLHSAQRGYSLIEVAIVLAVVGIVLGGSLLPIGDRLRARSYRQAETSVAVAVDALVGFALSSGYPQPYLPCPDTDRDGYEDRIDFDPISRLSCSAQAGLLPWKTLGIKAGDPWGNLLSYVVESRLTRRLAPDDPSDDYGLLKGSRILRGRVNSKRHSLDYLPLVICSELEAIDACAGDERRSFKALSTTYSSGEFSSAFRSIVGYYRPGSLLSVRELRVDPPYLLLSASIPFAVISPGPNLKGSCLAHAPYARRNRNEDSDSLSVAEQWNATIGGTDCAGFVVPPGVRARTLSFRPIYAGRHWDQVRNKRFSSSARTENFDDIVGWLSMAQLRAILAGAQSSFQIDYFR